jgi:hypothetical protein
MDERKSSKLPDYPQLSSNQRLKSPRSINDLTTPVINERQSLTKSFDALPDYPRSSSRINRDLTTPLLNSRDSLVKMSREPPNYPRSVDTSISSRNTKDFISPLTGEQELLARITGEPSLTPLNQRAKISRNTNDLMNSSINERERLVHPRLTPMFSSNQLVKSSNEPSNPSPRIVIEPPSRPKPAARSNPKVSSQKSIHGKTSLLT